MEDRVFFPVLFQFLHGQSLEQLLFPLEVGLQRGQQQAFPEASGAAEEVILSGSNQLIDQGCLVNIEIAVLANFLEVLYADGINCLVHGFVYLCDLYTKVTLSPKRASNGAFFCTVRSVDGACRERFAFPQLSRGLNQPLLDIAGLGREVHADLEDLPVVSGEG